MAQASLTESQESSPHGQAAQDPLLENVLMLEPHGLSPWASTPDITPRVESGASLQITAPAGSFILFYDMQSFVACIRCLWHRSQLPG
jgi:hypothetical protein